MKNHNLDCASFLLPFPVSMCERLLCLICVCVCVFMFVFVFVFVFVVPVCTDHQNEDIF